MNCFPEREYGYDTPKLIYICAPLRGDVEKNVKKQAKNSEKESEEHE